MARGRPDRIADFPHFNVRVHYDFGRSEIVHIYHTPRNSPEGVIVVLATVGTRANNLNAIINAFIPHGISLSHTDEVLFTG
jgi:hypothetical protein